MWSRQVIKSTSIWQSCLSWQIPMVIKIYGNEIGAVAKLIGTFSPLTKMPGQFAQNFIELCVERHWKVRFRSGFKGTSMDLERARPISWRLHHCSRRLYLPTSFCLLFPSSPECWRSQGRHWGQHILTFRFSAPPLTIYIMNITCHVWARHHWHGRHIEAISVIWARSASCNVVRASGVGVGGFYGLISSFYLRRSQQVNGS